MAIEFYQKYFNYIGDTEAPLIYHRWCAISIVAALLGRNVYFPFGHSRIYPNMYIMLEGNPGARKGTALKPARNLLKGIEFAKLAPDRLSAERFIAEMQLLNQPETIDGIEFEKLNFETPSEIYVMAAEFQDFIGTANISFIVLLTNLWDNLDEYKHPKLHGKSVYVYAPTVNLIAAANQQSIAQSLPIEAIGQGGTSRIILVHGEPTGKQITFPKPVSQQAKLEMESLLKHIQENMHGEITISSSARHLLDRVYKEYCYLDDFRFNHYNTRRFDHILKLCIVFAAMDCLLEIQPQHVLQANTLLHATEQRMGKALGQFGKGKHSDVANACVEFIKTNLTRNKRPATVREIWKQVDTNLNKFEELAEILRNLEAAEKIQIKELAGRRGYVPLTKIMNGWKDDMLLLDFLTPEEMP